MKIPYLKSILFVVGCGFVGYGVGDFSAWTGSGILAMCLINSIAEHS